MNPLTWVDRTCEDCRFRVDSSCRRFPHNQKYDGFHQTFINIYPCVAQDRSVDFLGLKMKVEYSPACAEWIER